MTLRRPGRTPPRGDTAKVWVHHRSAAWRTAATGGPVSRFVLTLSPQSIKLTGDPKPSSGGPSPFRQQPPRGHGALLRLNRPAASGLWIAVFGCLLTVNDRPRRAAAEPTAAVGINLAGPADWNTEIPFANLFRMSRPWISQRDGAGWGKGPPLELDEHGYVKRLQPGCYAETLLATIPEGHFPGGRYVVLYDGRGTADGKGTIDAGRSGKVVQEQPGRVVLDVNPARGGIQFRLRATDPADPVRNIRVLLPGTETTYQTNPWNPTLLARWKGVACVRFMDFMHTNNSEIQTWADRPTMADATWAKHGVPVEMLCDLATRLKCDAWFCIPHQADDDYVREFARVVKNKLPATQKAYIEYSNEVWNQGFKQHKYAADRGTAAGLADRPAHAALLWTGRRSGQIFDIFEKVMGGTERLVRVLPAQSANPWTSTQVVTADDVYQRADVLAIAPYISLRATKQEAPQVVSAGLDALFEQVKTESLPAAIEAMKKQKAVADQYGLRLVCYEAGQHLVGVRGGENNAELTELFITANADPRMGQVYVEYLKAWNAVGGDLMCLFSSVSKWGKFGSWGLLQYADQTPADSPKMAAVVAWAKSLGQPIGQ